MCVWEVSALPAVCCAHLHVTLVCVDPVEESLWSHPLHRETTLEGGEGGVGVGGVERGRQVSHGWRNTRRWDFSPSLARTPRALIRKTNAGRQTGK